MYADIVVSNQTSVYIGTANNRMQIRSGQHVQARTAGGGRRAAALAKTFIHIALKPKQTEPILRTRTVN